MTQKILLGLGGLLMMCIAIQLVPVSWSNPPVVSDIPNIFATWYKAARFLQSGLLDPSPIITHRFPLAEFDQAMDLIAHGECGKVLLIP